MASFRLLLVRAGEILAGCIKRKPLLAAEDFPDPIPIAMRLPSLLFCLLPSIFCLPPSAFSQIAAPVTTGEPVYRAEGRADQPFSLDLLDAHRTVNNTLLVRLALTNKGAAPLQAGAAFADPANPADANTLSAVYAVDPNGQRKLPVLRDAQRRPLCSRLEPDLQPGERREVFVQLTPPAETSSSVTLVFPLAAKAISGIPIGLSGAGEPLPLSAAIGDPGRAPAPAAPVPPGQPTGPANPESNNQPNYYSNLPGSTAANAVRKGVGSVQSANSTTPFTLEGVEVSRVGKSAVLRMSLTNNGSGTLEAAGQFTTGVADGGDTQQISGVFLVDPKTQQRYSVVRDSQTHSLCTKIDPAMAPGERRPLEATFPALPPETKSVYVYFPHATPIAEVPVTGQ